MPTGQKQQLLDGTTVENKGKLILKAQSYYTWAKRKEYLLYYSSTLRGHSPSVPTTRNWAVKEKRSSIRRYQLSDLLEISSITSCEDMYSYDSELLFLKSLTQS